MSSQTWNQNKAPLVNRYIDALHNSASPPPNVMESGGSITIETNGRLRNSVTPLRRKDSQQDSVGRSNSPKMKKLGARPTPEELVYSQGQGSQRFQSARPSTTPSSFSFGSPRGTFDTVSSAVSGGNLSTPQRSPICPRDSAAGIPSTFQVIPQTNSIDSTDTDWEDDFSSASENAHETNRIAHVDSTQFPSQSQNPAVRRLNNEYYGAQQDHCPEENNGSENEIDNVLPSVANLRSIKDRIKSFQQSGTSKSESSVAAPIALVTSNGDQDHSNNEDKENGENWTNNSIIKRSTTTFGAVSQGNNMNTFRNSSSMKSLAPPSTTAATPVSSSKKPAVTASFLVAINKYSPRQQQEKLETHSSQKDSNQTLRETSPLEMKDDKKPNACVTPNHQTSVGECAEAKCFLPTPGSSSTLIASWRQREASNVASSLPKAHPSCKKMANVTLPSIPVLQNKFGECDTRSEVENSENSPNAPPVIKSMKNISTASLKSLSDGQLDTLSNIIDQQVEARLLHLECQMGKDFRDQLEEMEARMNTKINKLMNLIQAQR